MTVELLPNAMGSWTNCFPSSILYLVTAALHQLRNMQLQPPLGLVLLANNNNRFVAKISSMRQASASIKKMTLRITLQSFRTA